MRAEVTTEEFEALYRETAPDVLRFLRRRTVGDGEDLLGEVYAVAWRRRRDLPAPMLRRAWLFRVAHNLLKADARRRRREGEVVRELAARPSGTEGGGDAARAEVVATALHRLAAPHREILLLVTWEGLTPAELAVVLGVRPGTVRVRLHRARQAFAADPEIRALREGASVVRSGVPGDG